MKNTRINFYWVYIEHDSIYKAQFETIIEGTPFESMADAEQWEEDETFALIATYGPGVGNIVLDRVVTKYSNTTKPVSYIHVLKKLLPGRIVFTDIKAQNRRLKRELAKAKEPPKAVVPKIERKEYTSCWIDPFGEQFDMFGVAQHNEFAHETLEGRYKKTLSEINDDNRYPYEILQDMGWARILGWTDPPTFVLPTKMNVSQKRAIKDYCLYERLSFPERLKW